MSIAAWFESLSNGEKVLVALVAPSALVAAIILVQMLKHPPQPAPGLTWPAYRDSVCTLQSKAPEGDPPRLVYACDGKTHVTTAPDVAPSTYTGFVTQTP